MNEQEIEALVNELTAAGATEQEIAAILDEKLSSINQPKTGQMEQPVQIEEPVQPRGPGGAGFESVMPWLNKGAAMVNRGLTQLVSAPLQMEGALEQSLGVKNPIQAGLEYAGIVDESEPWALQLGNAVENLTKEYNPVDPEFEQSITGQVLQGLGQAGAMVATMGGSAAPQLAMQASKMGLGEAVGLATKELAKQVVSPAGFIGGSMTAVPEWKQAKEAGASDEEAFEVLMENYLVGQTEALPLKNMLGRINKLTGNSLINTFKGMASGGFEEGVQEGIQTYLSNQIAKGNYDPDRDPLFQVLESAKVGGIVGLIIPGIGGIVKSAPADVKQKLSDKIIELQVGEEVQNNNTGNPIIDETIDKDAEIDPNTKQTVNATQEQEAGEVPVQSETGSSQEIPSTQSEEEPEVIIQPKSKEELVSEFKSSPFITNLSPVKEETSVSKEERAENIADFLRTNDVNTPEQIEEFVQTWNTQEIKPFEIIPADIVRVSKRLETPKAVPFSGETVTRTINEEIKRLSQERGKGKTEGVRVGQEFKNDLVKRVQEAAKTSNLSTAQMGSILSRIRKTNSFTAGSVSKLQSFVNKVMTDADYADKVEQANSLRSTVKKQAKSKTLPPNIRDSAQSFSGLDPELFDSISDYTQLAEHISNGLRSSASNKYSAYDEFKVSNLLNKQRLKQEQEELRKELGDFTEEEINDMIDKGESVDVFLSNKEEAKRIEVLDNLRTKAEYSKLALESESGLEEYASDEDEREILKSFLSVDTNKMSADAMTAYIRSVDNILLNGDFSGSQKTAIKIEASQAVQNLLELTQKNKKSKIGYLREDAFHLSQLIDTIYNSNTIAGDFTSESGVDGVLSAGSDTNTTFHSKTDQFTDFSNQLDKKYKGDKTTSKDNEVKVLMIGLLSRTTDGSSHLSKVRSNIDQSIKLYENSTDEEDQKLGIAMRKAYDKYKNAETSDDVLEIAKKQEPKAYESWKWAQDNLFDSKFTAASKKTTNNLYNQSFVPEKNYFPYSQKNMTSSTEETNEEAGKPSVLTLRPQQSRNTLKATRSLSPGFAYDTDVFKNLFRTYKSTLYDTKSAKHIQLLHDVTSHPDFEQIVGGKENKKKLVDTLKKVVAEQYGKTQNDGELVKAINDFLHIGKDLGTATALGGVDQIFSQTVPTWVAASANLGSDAGLMFMPNAVSMIPGQETQFEKEVISKARVGEAGQRHGGTDLGELSNKFISDDNKVPFLRGLEAVRRFTGKASHIKLFFLTKGDVLVRRKAFSAFYVQRLIQQGIDPKTIDLNSEGEKQNDPKRKKAKAYADNMVSNLQVPSNRAEMAQILQKGGGYDTLRTIFLPFSVFSLNTKNRLARGIKKAQINPAEGSKEIAGVLAESVMFSMVKTYLIAGVYYPMLEWMFRKIFGLEEPEEEDNTEGNFWEGMEDFIELKDFRKMLTNVVNDVSPIAVGIGQTANAALINRIGYMSRDKKLYGDYTYDEWLSETKGVINRPYESDFSDLGVLGVGAQKLFDMGNAASDAATVSTGEDTIYYNTIYGDQESDVSDIKDLVFFNALMESVDVVAPREFGNAWSKVYSQQLENYEPTKKRRRRLQEQ